MKHTNKIMTVMGLVLSAIYFGFVTGANAFCVYNDTRARTLWVLQVQGGSYDPHPYPRMRDEYGDDRISWANEIHFSKQFNVMIKPNSKKCCNWKNSSCNKVGKRTSEVRFLVGNDIERKFDDTRSLSCYSNKIMAGGYLKIKKNPNMIIDFDKYGDYRRIDEFLCEVGGLCRTTPISRGAGARVKLDAALHRQGNYYLFKGNKFVWHKNRKTGKPQLIKDHWPGLPEMFQRDLDAVFRSPRHEHIAYFAKGDQYAKFDMNKKTVVDTGLINDGWKGRMGGNDKLWHIVEKHGGKLDAACAFWDKKRTYFFAGDTYIRYKWGKGVDKVSKIDKGFRGLWGNDISACADSNNPDLMYFFKNNRYARYSMWKDHTEKCPKDDYQDAWNVPKAFFD